MSSNETIHQNLDELFPVPSLPPSQLAPQKLPGVNLESLAAIQDVLKDDYRRHHIFFNNRGFHNHVIHRALAIYALGGPAAIIREYYDRDSQKQRPALDSPEPIIENNFVEHLGNENFYQAYLSFFCKQVSEKGAAGTLEEFIFSKKYNFQEGRDTETQPEMLARFYDGLMHPLIHTGYGVEFGLKGMLVEGLALTAVRKLSTRRFFLPPFFVTGSASIGMDHIAARLSSLVLDTRASPVSKTDGIHAFDIVARMLKDDGFKCVTAADYPNKFAEKLAEYMPILREYAEKWTIDLDQPGEVERKMEEIVWLSSLLYGVGGITPNGFRSEFYMMHLVTSSLFLPSLIAYLSPGTQVLLLRGFFSTVLAWWVVRGRPDLNIKQFMATTSVPPSVPSMTPAPKDPLTTETTPTPNPFLPILQSAITHPNNHMVKIQRAFAHFDTLYGTRPVGYFKGTGLDGAELLDGSLFLKCSLLTADYVGWVREGKEPRPFSLEGFYDA